MNSLYDSTINCVSTLAQSSVASNETFTYKGALQQSDYHDFVKAMIHEVNDNKDDHEDNNKDNNYDDNEDDNEDNNDDDNEDDNKNDNKDNNKVNNIDNNKDHNEDVKEDDKKEVNKVLKNNALSFFNNSCLRKLIVNSVSEGAQQVTPNQQFAPDTIYNKSFELIDVSVPTKNKMCGAYKLAGNEHKCLNRSDISAFQSIVEFNQQHQSTLFH